MSPLLVLALCIPTNVDTPVGWLHPSREYSHQQTPACTAPRPYYPREGDLIFFTDDSPVWEFLYGVGGTSPPYHVGLVVRKPDGRLAVLESGPDDTLHVFVLDIHPRLYRFKGDIHIRQNRRPLTPDQSRQLTAFAMAQEGKRYAMWRLLGQGTPLRARGKRSATTHMDRKRWLCAEVVVAGATLVGLFDSNQVKATATYPRDIIDNHRYDLSHCFEEAAVWRP